MDSLTIIGSICSILAFLFSGYAVYRVTKLEQSVNQSGDNNKSINQSAKGNNNIQTGQQ